MQSIVCRLSAAVGFSRIVKVASKAILPLAVVFALGFHTAPANADGVPFQKGDVLIAMNFGSGYTWDNQIKHFAPNGTLLDRLDFGISNNSLWGLGFDASDNLYAVLNNINNNVYKFNANGIRVGTFGGGYLFPTDITFDKAGNVYVGEDAYSAMTAGKILKFDPHGNLLATFVAQGDSTSGFGVNFLALAPDQCTMRYDSMGYSIKQFDVCNNLQLPDLVTGLADPLGYQVDLYQLRGLPDGEILVGAEDTIFLLDSSGGIIRNYKIPSTVPSYPYAEEPNYLDLDPDGQTFWVIDTYKDIVYRVDFQTGAILAQFNVDNANWNNTQGSDYLAVVPASNTTNITAYIVFPDPQPQDQGDCDGQGSACTPEPINIGNGGENLNETDYRSGDGRLTLGRSYHSADTSVSAMSQGWQNSWLARRILPEAQTLPPALQQQIANSSYASPTDACSAVGGTYANDVCSLPSGKGVPVFSSVDVTTPSAGFPQPLSGTAFSVQRPDGGYVPFTCPSSGAGVCTTNSDRPETLARLGDGTYQFTDEDDTQEIYAANGQLQSVTQRGGYVQLVNYDANTGLLSSVNDSFGRSLSFHIVGNQLQSVTTPDGVIQYGYDTKNRLSLVTYPSATAKQYQYNDAAHPNAVTGVEDENSQTFASIVYSDANGASSGYAQSSAVGGFSTSGGLGAWPSSLDYTDPTTPVMTDSLGVARSYHFTTINGRQKLTSITAPDGSAAPPCVLCGSGKAQSYDAAGYYQSITDWNGNTTKYVFEDTRGLELSRTEAAGTAQARTITTAWNASYRVPDEIDVYAGASASGTPLRKTSFTYDTSGNLLTRTVSDPSTGATRTWTFSNYTANGQPQTIDGPRTDVADVTQIAYYPVVAGDSKSGQIKTITNAMGQAASFLSYDSSGRVLRLQDANGTFVDTTYNARGWLLTRTVRANADGSSNPTLDATTIFAHDNVGNVTRVTQPDGAFLAYGYDAGHRLTDITDNAGDHIHYTLDAVGNRTNVSIYDPGNTLKRTLTRQYDQLDHLTKMLNAGNVAVQTYTNPAEPPPAGIGYTDGYDGNGNPVYSVDANGIGTESQFDPLNRLVKELQDHAGTGATHDTTTQVAYDALDHVRSVTDPDNLTTNYGVDGLNELTSLSSPDTGNASYFYDAAGNRTSKTDAKGVTATYSYDALNRLIGISYPTTSLNVTYAYDVPANGCFNIGRLTGITDSSGTTTYCYDRRGNVLTKTQVTNGATFTTGYTYTLADRLSTITYPSGAIVTYGRDSVGRVTSVTYKANATATAQTILSNVSYFPFGPANVFTYGNGRTLTKTYDENYAIGSVASSDPNGLAIQAHVDALGNLTAASNTAHSLQYGYDALYRLTNVGSGGGLVEGYTYTGTSDRLSKTVPPQAVQAYGYAAGTHHLISAGTDTRTFDANGNTTSSSAASTVFTYDDRNRLSAVGYSDKKDQKTRYAYLYNGRGERVGKQHLKNGKTKDATDYVYNETGQLLGEYPAAGKVSQAEYVYIDATPIAYVTNGTLYYVETDQLGTPRELVQPGATAATDTVVWKWDYFGSAFGENAPSVQAIAFNLRFPGQYYDAESGLNYNYFRDYEPGTGRYIESDPIGLLAGTSTYAYVGSNPVKTVDSYGFEGTGPWTFPAGPMRDAYYASVESSILPDGSRVNNPYLNTNMGVGAMLGAGGVVVAVNVIGFPEAEIGEGVAVIAEIEEETAWLDALAGEPVGGPSIGQSVFYLNWASIGAMNGATMGYLLTPPMQSKKCQ